MPSSVQKVLDDALRLSREDRARLLDELIRLDAESTPADDDAFMQEVQRRLDRYDRGEVTLHTPEEVEQYVRSKNQSA